MGSVEHLTTDVAERKIKLHLFQNGSCMYGISYNIVDLMDEFTLLEAACYWVDIPACLSFEKIPDIKKSEVKRAMDMLLKAGKEGRLRYARPPKTEKREWVSYGRSFVHNWKYPYKPNIPRRRTIVNYMPPTFYRADLIAFAESIGKKPLFLFHEGRKAPLMVTAAQTADYTRHGYKCYDHLHIPGTSPMKRSNDVAVNGHIVKIPDKSFQLLMELVVELKKGEGGWLTIYTEEGKYQIFDRLRKPIEGSLKGKDAEKFIENDGSKRYRISTHPDFIFCDLENLLKHTDPEVRTFAKNIEGY